MLNILHTEATRIEIQNQVDLTKTVKERNKLGQFATPAQLADEVVNYTLSLLSENEKICFLDPAIGTGSFFSALIRAVAPAQIENAIGYEIDKVYAQIAIDLWHETCLKVFIGDFLEIDSPKVKPNLIICNPPYVRHQHLSIDKKLALRKVVADKTGINLSGLSGLYCYFILASHDWMSENGIASWLIPSEFMDVNYGQEIKEFLLNKVTLLRVHRFDPLDLQFDDALVSNSVVWFKKSLPAEQHLVKFTFGGTITKPSLSKYIRPQNLKPSAKWSNIFTHGDKQKSLYKLSDLFEIKRGIATGANEFFILTPEKINKFEIPSDVLIPILPSTRYLHNDEVLADNEKNPIVDKPRFLLSCTKSMDEIKSLYPSVWSYLQSGINAGVNKGYLCQHRSLWYVQEIRQPTKFLCSYMGRQISKAARPFRFIYNESKAIAPNIYLMMYPKPHLSKMISEQPELSRKVWNALNTIPISDMLGEGRVYGNGLHKLEPKELANVPADMLYEIPSLKT
jgi:adenine-specific DNA-methyltransferase